MPDGERGGGIPGLDWPLDVGEVLAWLREHWLAVAGVAVVLILLLWLASGDDGDDEIGRYVLVKDGVPCEVAGGQDERKWCYLVLDTRNGRLEERVRKFRRRDGRR